MTSNDAPAVDGAVDAQPVAAPPLSGPVVGRPVGEIRALCDAATPGPWEHVVGEGSHLIRPLGGDRPPSYPVARVRRDNIGHCDAEFIAAARDLVPSLLAEVEAADRFEQQAGVEREALIAEVERLRRVADLAAKVMATLAEYGPGIVGHLLDTDDNDGERLRAAVAAAADAPQPEPELRCERPGGCVCDPFRRSPDCRWSAGPSPAVLPEKEQQR